MKSIAVENTIYRDRPELTSKLSPCARFTRTTPAYDMNYRRVESNIPRLSERQGLILSALLQDLCSMWFLDNHEQSVLALT